MHRSTNEPLPISEVIPAPFRLMDEERLAQAAVIDIKAYIACLITMLAYDLEEQTIKPENHPIRAVQPRTQKGKLLQYIPGRVARIKDPFGPYFDLTQRDPIEDDVFHGIEQLLGEKRHPAEIVKPECTGQKPIFACEYTPSFNFADDVLLLHRVEDSRVDPSNPEMVSSARKALISNREKGYGGNHIIWEKHPHRANTIRSRRVWDGEAFHLVELGHDRSYPLAKIVEETLRRVEEAKKRKSGNDRKRAR